MENEFSKSRSNGICAFSINSSFAIDPEFQLRETLDSQNWKWKSAKVIYVTKWAPSKPKIAE